MSQAAPTPSPDVDIAALRERFAELRAHQASARRTMALLVFTIIAFFGVFTFVTLNRVKDNFNQPAVHKAVADRLPAVAPIAQAQVQKAALAALPVYRELAVARYEQIRPELAAKAFARLDAVPDRTGRLMADRLSASLDKAVKRVGPELSATFPSLTDAQKQQLLADYFHDAIAGRNKDVAAHIDTMYTNELIAVHSALDKFEVPTADAAANPDQLQRDFLHSLLVLAAYELLNADGAPVVPATAKKTSASADSQASAR